MLQKHLHLYLVHLVPGVGDAGSRAQQSRVNPPDQSDFVVGAAAAGVRVYA